MEEVVQVEVVQVEVVQAEAEEVEDDKFIWLHVNSQKKEAISFEIASFFLH